jgi:hypothetical protein
MTIGCKLSEVQSLRYRYPLRVKQHSGEANHTVVMLDPATYRDPAPGCQTVPFSAQEPPDMSHKCVLASHLGRRIDVRGIVRPALLVK